MKTITLNKYIVADPEVSHGKPIFKGTRIMVWQVLEMFSDRQKAEDILAAFPSLKPAHLKAALSSY